MLENTLDVVVDIKRKLEARAINIRWPSSESRSSSSPRKSKKRGPGFQFAGPKEYDAADGDEFRHIDWNASASEPDPDKFIVRTFMRPRLTQVHVLLDVNQSMNMGTTGTFKSLLGAVCAGSGIMSAKKVKDQASFLTYAQRPINILRARNPQRLLLPALYNAVEDRDLDPHEAPVFDWRRHLFGADDEAAPAKAEGGGLALSFRSVQQKKQNVVLVVSDFVNMNDDDWEALRVSGIKHDTIAAYVQDRRERELPEVPWPGMYYSIEDFNGRRLSFWIAPDETSNKFLAVLRRIFGNVTTRKQWAENWDRYEKAIQDRLTDCGVSWITVSTDEEREGTMKLLNLLANKMRK